VVLVILFQPELRKAWSRSARSHPRFQPLSDQEENEHVVREITTACFP
jgi:hypothetical protein